VVKVAVVWVKVYDVEVKMEVVWMDEAFTETIALLTGQCSAVKPVFLPRYHSEGAQSIGYIQGMLTLYP